MGKLQKLRLGRLTVLSCHPVLDQVARDLVAGLRVDSLPDTRITVYVGLHRKFGIHRFRLGKRVAIQTEHYFDADGRKMWRKMKRWRTLIAAILNHRIMDLSASNHPHYDFLPAILRQRVSFGPEIFPCAPPEFRPGTDGSFLFFGEINERRRLLIMAQPSGMVDVARPGTFSDDLQHLMARASGILNLHYAEGRYSEMPRLLAACLAGKVIMSEPLGDELVQGRDYLALGHYPSENQARMVFENFWRNFAIHHRFSDFLRNVAGRS